MVVLAKRETSHAIKQFERKITLPSWVKPGKMSAIKCYDETMTVSFPREIQETRPGGLPHPRVTYDDNQFNIVLDTKNIK